MDYVIEVSNLAKTYPLFKLNNLNLKLGYGKIIGLIGENGAGKTTFISLLLNQIKRDDGIVKIFGKDIIKNEIEIKQNIGFIIDECIFHPCFTAKDVKKICKPIYKKWDDNIFDSLLKKFDVSLSKKISELSKGMKTKLMLAVALSHKPGLLILDEVTSGLDPLVRDEILILLKEYVSQTKTTVFFSTHITSDLDKIADDIVFIHSGNLIFHKTIEEIKNNYLFMQCSLNEYKNINKNDVCISYHDGDKYFLLIKNNLHIYENIGKASTPTIDNIMLLYIKGENNLCMD